MPAVRTYAGIAILLALQAAALVHQAKSLGLTVDEPSHYAAGHMYWLGQDVLQPADTPPLTRMVSGWIPRLARAPDPRATSGWPSRDAYVIGGEILRTPGKPARRLLYWTRLPFLVFPLGLVFLLWKWARELYGSTTAWFIAAFGALEPNLLGHGALIKSDVPAACMGLLAIYVAWRYWRTPTPSVLAALLLAVSLAAMTKYSLLPLVAPATALVWRKAPRPWHALLVPAAVWFAITISSLSIWPEQYLHGLRYIGGTLQREGFTGYLFGQKIHGWTPGYFPAAWALKYPVALQLLAAAGCVAAWRRRTNPAMIAIWTGVLYFFGTAVLSNFHIGFRHILTAVPFLLLAAGPVLENAGRWLPALCLVWLAAGTARVYPHGISYCNEWSGGPENCWHYLADSNVDWGQNYPEMARFMDAHGIEIAKSFLFSMDTPWHYMAVGRFHPQPWPQESTPPGTRFQPSPGIYAISVNLLTGLMFPKNHEDYLETFRKRTPIGRAGYSIYFYRVD